MAGTVVNILPMRLFDWGGVRALTGTQAVIAAQRIDISLFNYADIIVRLHQANGVTGTNTVSAQLFLDGYSDEDPGLPFLQQSGPGSNILSFLITFGSGDLAPNVGMSGTPIVGHYAFLVVSGTKSTNAPMTATLSADLCLRNQDPS